MLRMLSLATLAAVLAACAHDPAPPGEVAYAPVQPITRYADADRDGRVTRKEAQSDSNLARVFDHYDTNDDDVLDRAEFAQLEDESRREASQDQDGDRAPRVEPQHPERPITLNRTGAESLRRY